MDLHRNVSNPFVFAYSMQGSSGKLFGILVQTYCDKSLRNLLSLVQIPRHGFFRNRAAEQEIKNELKLLLILDNPFIIKSFGWGWTCSRTVFNSCSYLVPALCRVFYASLPRFREWFEDPCNGIFFVMELCAGPSLQSILEDA